MNTLLDRTRAAALGLLLALATFTGSAWAQAAGLQPVPALSARVVDTVNLLDASARTRIEDQLSNVVLVCELTNVGFNVFKVNAARVVILMRRHIRDSTKNM